MEGSSTHFMKSPLEIAGSISIMNYTNEDCLAAENASKNVIMQTIRMAHILISFMGILSTALFIFILFSKKAHHLHINVRLSLASLSVAALIASAQLFIIALYSLVHTFSVSDPCDFLYTSAHCAIVRFPVVLCIYSLIWGLIAIAVERAIATIKYRTYEAHGSWLVGGILILIQWSLSIGLSFFSLSIRRDPGYIHYCTAYVSHPKSSVFSISMMTIMECGTLIFFVALLNINKYKQVNEFVNNALHTLTERYQLQENVRIMQILIPSVTVHATLSLFGLGTMLGFALTTSNLDGRLMARFAPYAEMVMLLIPIYAIVFPCVAVLRNKQLSHTAKKTLPWLFLDEPPTSESTCEASERMLPVTPKLCSKQYEKEADTHFGLLTEMWSK